MPPQLVMIALILTSTAIDSVVDSNLKDMIGARTKLESSSPKPRFDSISVFEAKFRDKIRLFDVDSGFSSGCNSMFCYADIIRRLKIGNTEYSLIRSRFNQSAKVHLLSRNGTMYAIGGVFESAPDSFYQSRGRLRMVWIVNDIRNNEIRYSAKKGEYMYLIQPSEILNNYRLAYGDSIRQESIKKLHSKAVLDSIKQWNASCPYLRALLKPLYCLDFIDYYYMNKK